jgi:DNA-directed RNA polymerase specialized sigma24 family protein
VINRFLGSLEKQSREIFVKRYWCGLTLADLAEDYDMSYSKAASLLHRLRAGLKTELEKEGIMI